MRKGGGASGSMRSQVNSTGDAINVSSNHEFVPPNSAPENLADESHKSGKKLKAVDVELNRSQAMNSRQPASNTLGPSNTTNPAKVSNLKQTYNVPTHRRSNTAASFVPTMTLK